MKKLFPVVFLLAFFVNCGTNPVASTNTINSGDRKVYTIEPNGVLFIEKRIDLDNPPVVIVYWKDERSIPLPTLNSYNFSFMTEEGITIRNKFTRPTEFVVILL